MMFAFGSGVYLYLGTLKSKVVKQHALLPTVTKPKFVLPGTMIVVQDGRLFKLSAGNFTEIGPSGDWSQPALTPDHSRLSSSISSNPPTITAQSFLPRSGLPNLDIRKRWRQAALQQRRRRVDGVRRLQTGRRAQLGSTYQHLL